MITTAGPGAVTVNLKTDRPPVLPTGRDTVTPGRAIMMAFKFPGPSIKRRSRRALPVPRAGRLRPPGDKRRGDGPGRRRAAALAVLRRMIE